MARRYGLVVGVLAALLATGLQWLAWEHISPSPWLFMYPAVFAAAWLGGLEAGLVTTAACALLAWYLFMPPRLSFALPELEDTLLLAMFTAMGVLVCLLFEQVRRAGSERDAARLEALAGQSLVGVYVIEGERFRYVNEALATMFGYASPAELIESAAVLDLVAPEDRVQVAENLRRRASGEADDVRYAFTGLTRDGRRIALESHGRSALEGGRRSVLGAVIDISGRRRAEAALAASEARYRLATQAAKEAIWERNIVDGTVQWNDAYRELFGRMPEDGESSAWWESRLHPEDRARVTESFAAALAGADAWYCDYRIMTPAGGYAWVKDRAVIVRDEDGRPLTAIGAKLDVTEHVLAERALTEARHDLERAQAMGHIGSWRLDTATNELRWSNELYRLFGIPQGRPLEFADFLAAVHPEDRDALAGAWDGALAGRPYDFEHRILVDGAVRWCRECAELERDAAGKVMSAFGTCQDITERKLALERLHQLTEAVGEMAGVRTLPELLAIVCRATRSIIGCDGATVVLRDEEQCHYVGEDAITPLWQGQRFLLAQRVSGRVMERGEPDIIEDTAGHPDVPEEAYGHTFVRALSIVPVGRPTASGALGCYWARPHRASPEELRLQRALADAAAIGLANLELIARLEKARLEAERYAQAKSAFLANMSHEIRTPLHGVLAFAQIGQRDSAREPRTEQMFRRILESGRMLLGIIDDVLDFSKIEAGKLDVESIAVQPRQVALESVELFRAQAEDKGLVLAARFADDLPAACLADPLRLRQILTNLLSNALKFTSRGEVTLTVARAGAMLSFRVADTGTGMSAEQLTQIFEPFRQGDSSTTRRYGGSGLGLTICRQLAALMGGEIRVESRPGEGSTFDLRLPLVEAPPDALPAAEPLPPAPGQRRLAGMKVLVAEDNTVNCLVLEDFLQGEGAAYEIVGDGRQAVARIAAGGHAEFDAILMDIQMPEMDGYEATRRILEIAPHLPIVGQTAHAMAEESAKCHAAGMVAHLAKPIELEHLVAALQQHALRRLKRA
ncbi:MAG: PAS domain S-box protein [Gammaproteobacteria bacterium]|nr:PAS domain S-box protein [Gammaproteobacteria bacterium]